MSVPPELTERDQKSLIGCGMKKRTGIGWLFAIACLGATIVSITSCITTGTSSTGKETVVLAHPTTKAAIPLGLLEKGTSQQIQDEISQGADVHSEVPDLRQGQWIGFGNPNGKYSNIDTQPPGGFNTVMMATFFNPNPGVIQVLVNAGVDPNAHQAYNGMTALMLAAYGNSNDKVITALLKAGANLSARDKLGRTALEFAAMGQYPDNVLTLVKAGANLFARDISGHTALEIARNESGSEQVVRTLTDATDKALVTFFKSATAGEVRIAIQVGETIHEFRGVTPLMFAARYDSDPGVITELVKAGAVVGARDHSGRTALMYAAEYNTNPAMITALLRAGEAVNNRDNNGNSALMLAAKDSPSAAVIKVLLDSGADLKAHDYAGETALTLATEYNKNPWVTSELAPHGSGNTAKKKTGQNASSQSEEAKAVELFAYGHIPFGATMATIDKEFPNLALPNPELTKPYLRALGQYEELPELFYCVYTDDFGYSWFFNDKQVNEQTTSLDRGSVRSLSLFFLHRASDQSTSSARLFIVDKILPEPQSDDLGHIFDASLSAISNVLGAPAKTWDAHYSETGWLGGQASGGWTPGKIALWSTPGEFVYLLVASTGFGFTIGAPQIIYVDKSLWSEYVQGCKGIQAKQKEQQEKNQAKQTQGGF